MKKNYIKNKNKIMLNEEKKEEKSRIKFTHLTSFPKYNLNFNKLTGNNINKIEFIQPIRKTRKDKTMKLDVSKMLNSVSQGLNKKIKKKFNFQRLHSFDVDTKKKMFEISSFIKDEKYISKAIQIFKYGAINFNESKIFISFLYNLEPFNQILSESSKDEIENILQNLSLTLKYEYIPKNKIICKYGQNVEKFYLILRGKVDILVPNEEEILLTEEEYFRYLLNLKIYGENNIINKILSKNYLTFVMEEKTFEEWVKTAYNTLELLGEKYKLLNDPLKTDINQNNFIIKPEMENIKPQRNIINNRRISFFNSNPRKKITGFKVPLSPKYNKRIRKSLLIVNNEKKKVFDTIEKKNMVFRLKEQILLAMKIIEPYNPDLLGVNIGNYISNNVTSEEYINRTKPFLFNYKLNELRKPAKIISYFIAKTLKSGDKFGDMMNEVYQSNKSERYSTIISQENSDFGTLDRFGYTKCLKNVSERMRRKKLNFLLNANIFRNCNKNLFTKSFTSFFSKRLLYSHENLFSEGDDVKKNQMIYFIRDGEICANCRKTIYEINKIFLDLNYNNLVDPEDDDDCLDKENDQYIKFKNRKRFIKIQYFKENDILGLNDCFYNGKYIYTATCSSPTATVYEIHINFFKLILSADKKIAENVTYEEMVKRNLTMKLLLKFRNDKINYFKYYSKGGDTLSFGCLTLRNDNKNNNENSFKRLLEEREMAKKGKFFCKSKHKRKLNIIVDNTRDLYEKEPELFTIKKYYFIDEDEEENNIKNIKKSRNGILYKNAYNNNNNSLIPVNFTDGNKKTISSSEDDYPKILTNKFIMNKSKYDNNTTCHSYRKSNLLDNPLTDRKKNLTNDIIESYSSDRRLIKPEIFRKDNTILPVKKNITEKLRKTKYIINHLSDFYTNEKMNIKDKKFTVFNMTNKSMYKTIFYQK